MSFNLRSASRWWYRTPKLRDWIAPPFPHWHLEDVSRDPDSEILGGDLFGSCLNCFQLDFPCTDRQRLMTSGEWNIAPPPIIIIPNSLVPSVPWTNPSVWASPNPAQSIKKIKDGGVVWMSVIYLVKFMSSAATTTYSLITIRLVRSHVTLT